MVLEMDGLLRVTKLPHISLVELVRGGSEGRKGKVH